MAQGADLERDRLREVLDDDHPATLLSMNNLAAVRRELGKL